MNARAARVGTGPAATILNDDAQSHNTTAATGQVCAGCLEPNPTLRPMIVDGERHRFCSSCRDAIPKMRSGKRIREPVKARLMLPASEDDRLWFERHAGRNHRIRSPIGGEAFATGGPPPGQVRLIAVRQVWPGARLKASFVWPPDAPVPVNSEAAAAELYEEASSRLPYLGELEAMLRERAP
jgi:hypothetical protein